MKYNGKTDCSPQEAGYNPDVLDVYDAHLQRVIDKKAMQGAGYLMARKGKVFAHRAFGSLSYKNAGDYKPNSLRGIASVTKVFTATAILQLMEQGKLNIEQSVSDILEEFKTDMHKGITILQLLTHTSGLPADGGAMNEPYPSDFESFKKKLHSKNWIKSILTGPLQYKPGTVWSYCTNGFFFLAEIVKKITGLDIDQYVEMYILKPLGMTDSSYIIPPEKSEQLCITSEWDLLDKTATRQSFLNDLKVSSLWGGFGLFSTLYDLWKFGQMMLNKGTFNGVRILGRKTVEAATRIQIDSYPSYNWGADMFDSLKTISYGYGWQLRKHSCLPNEVFLHEGSGGSVLAIDPTEDFVYVHLHPDNDFCRESWHNSMAVVWSGIE